MSIYSTSLRTFAVFALAALVLVSMSCSAKKAEEILDLGDGVKLELVLIPAGEFIIESNDNRDYEKPFQRVTISKPFYMGKYEVTQEQYEKMMGKNPSHFKDSNNPVEMVSRDDALEFCKRLSQTTGYTISLPTQAQWEYACRSGATTRWNCGDDESLLGEYAWYGANSSGKTHPVGQKMPNAWGLYDMHGNVWEWCQDSCDNRYYGKSSASDSSRPATGSSRVARGGGWYDGADGCRSAYGGRNDPGSRGIDVGLRVVVVQ